jgi:hypothetical protein
MNAYFCQCGFNAQHLVEFPVFFPDQIHFALTLDDLHVFSLFRAWVKPE